MEKNTPFLAPLALPAVAGTPTERDGKTQMGAPLLKADDEICTQRLDTRATILI